MLLFYLVLKKYQANSLTTLRYTQPLSLRIRGDGLGRGCMHIRPPIAVNSLRCSQLYFCWFLLFFFLFFYFFVLGFPVVPPDLRGRRCPLQIRRQHVTEDDTQSLVFVVFLRIWRDDRLRTSAAQSTTNHQTSIASVHCCAEQCRRTQL